MTAEHEALTVVLTRDVPESHHVVDAVVAETSGPTTVWGRLDAPVIPRSAIKPVQAVPLVRTGAAEAYELSDVELALAAASHSGEPDHVAVVTAWLERIGLGVADLECGDDRPMHVASADRLVAAGSGFSALHNCCSGKHSGFLTIARHLGVEPAGYIHRSHPVQQLVTDAISQFTGLDLSHQSSGIDGCGIPTFAVPAVNLAVAMARVVRPGEFDDDTAEAATHVARAMIEYPWWVAGTGRPEVTFAAASREPVLLKGGAEGVFIAALPDRGIGIAVKSRDGARRGADTAMAAVLEHLGVLPPGHARTEITNKAGTVVGEMYVTMP